MHRLSQVALLVHACVSGVSSLKTFTALSEAIYLHRGEVHNGWLEPKAMPAEIVSLFNNKTMMFKSMELDIVRVDNVTGMETSLPLYEVYNHHHALILGPTKDLEKIYNYSKNRDPLNPGAGPRGKAALATERRLHKHHHGAGCMMRGDALRNLLNEVSHYNGGHKVSAFGGASGAEFRGTPSAVPAPYVYSAWNPQSFMVLMHFINTRSSASEEKLWECPCTKARDINITNGTIDGAAPIPFRCSEELLKEHNTACSLKTYEGGYRCCENGVYLTETKPPTSELPDQIQAKFTFTYYQDGELPSQAAKPLTSPGCCDATAQSDAHHFGNIEYDIPQCKPGTSPELCVHEITSIQPFFAAQNQSGHEQPVDPEQELELVHAWGHQHVGAISLELFRESTGELLCRTTPVYGAGTKPGDEAGYLVGIPPCVFGPAPLPAPPRLKRKEMLRTVARYNSTQQRHGVMSLWLLKAAELPSGAKRDGFFV
jgi:hypothetical protein